MTSHTDIKYGFYVFSPSFDKPRFLHQTQKLAEIEASRLAGNNPGAVFYVLETASAFCKQEVAYYDLKGDRDEIPF